MLLYSSRMRTINSIYKTMEVSEALSEVDENMDTIRDQMGIGPEEWVPVDHYEEIIELLKTTKELSLAAIEDEEERARMAAHWPFDDIDVCLFVISIAN